MINKQRGFVLFSVMLIVTMIALFSLMLLQADTENSRLTRMGVQRSVEQMKARAWLQAAIINYVGEGVACDSETLSPDALLHVDDGWWQAHACNTASNAWLVREAPLVSSHSVIATSAGWVAAQYRHFTLRYQTMGMPPLLMQALVAEPSTVSVTDITGKTVVQAGIQQLECLSD